MQRKKIKIAFKLSQNDRNHAASFYLCYKLIVSEKINLSMNYQTFKATG